MTTIAWAQGAARAVSESLGNDFGPTPQENVDALRDAAARLSDTPSPDAELCLKLDKLIQLAHKEMAVSSSAAQIGWRRLYTDACILRSLADIYSLNSTNAQKYALSCIARLDHAIIIAGAPGEGRLDFTIDLIAEVQSKCFRSPGAGEMLVPVPVTTPHSPTLPLTALRTYSEAVPRLDVPPSLTSFATSLSRRPFVLPGYICDWPAMNEHPWRSLDYLRAVTGPGRVVPVEIGRDYTEADWTQKMMPWDEFLDSLGRDSNQEQRPTLYLAQHNLLKQFPALRDDMMPPDYVYTSPSPTEDFPTYTPPANEDQLVLNTWLGPAGTISPAHTDPFFNFFAQVVGRKTVWLAPPSTTPSMYPYPPPSVSSNQARNPAANSTDPSMGNTSRVDVFSDTAANHGDYPLFWDNTVPQAMAVTLEPGELLFFPPGWWHAMRSEDTSFSVSMWF
ncbi:Clavaminate synthase-like protein [Sparassis crispa]|uniref:Clavaminate synthase-like protein n=1 Tax=Sparassis crispa TaxID=139825 RepID=A0A401GKH9_9APHY|nr:Clavaminate synthase-like protein [Sparassis crispa]GBE82677.1 Clavaminate synthase-like protein [Sparassis crispa]